jgi:hypothetical protein
MFQSLEMPINSYQRKFFKILNPKVVDMLKERIFKVLSDEGSPVEPKDKEMIKKDESDKTSAVVEESKD